MAVWLEEVAYSGVAVNDGYWTMNGNEEMLKKLVAKNGAVITGVVARGPFSGYRGGIFQGKVSILIWFKSIDIYIPF